MFRKGAGGGGEGGGGNFLNQNYKIKLSQYMKTNLITLNNTSSFSS